MTGLAFFFGKPCKTGPYYFETVWATLSIAIIVWANHIVFAPVLGLRAVGHLVIGILRDFAVLIFWILGLGLPILIVTPAYQCYTPRARAAEVFLSGSSLRPEIEARIRERQSTNGSGIGSEFKPTGKVRAGYVTSDGAIIVAGDDPPIVFVLSPVLKGQEITWICHGFPETVAPAMCRKGGQ